MLAGSKQLKLLQIDGMSQLTDNGISHIAERATQLESLRLHIKFLLILKSI